MIKIIEHRVKLHILNPSFTAYRLRDFGEK